LKPPRNLRIRCVTIARIGRPADKSRTHRSISARPSRCSADAREMNKQLRKKRRHKRSSSIDCEPTAAELGLTPEPRAVFDAEILRLQDDLSWRKATMGLPPKGRRADDIDKLRVAVENLKRAAAPFFEGPPGFLSSETQSWLLEAAAVATELATLTKPSRFEVLNKGFERPEGHREWLIGEQIPALFEKVYGEEIPTTPDGKTDRGRRGMDFVRIVLKELGEPAPKSNETIKHLIYDAKIRVRADKTGAGL
jgi:hypothetical protein